MTPVEQPHTIPRVKGNGKTEIYNGIIMKTDELALNSKWPPVKHWELVLSDVLHSIRSLVVTIETPHESLLSLSQTWKGLMTTFVLDWFVDNRYKSLSHWTCAFYDLNISTNFLFTYNKFNWFTFFILIYYKCKCFYISFLINENKKINKPVKLIVWKRKLVDSYRL